MNDESLKHKHAVIILTIIIAATLLVILWAGNAGEKHLPEATVAFELEEGVIFYCEVADTNAERAQGLMYRDELESDEGMLFVFDSPQNLTFWMKNTYIPLDMIFIDEYGVVINIAEANPEPGVADENLSEYKSEGPAKWVLEVNQGMSQSYGIMPGTEAIITVN